MQFVDFKAEAKEYQDEYLAAFKRTLQSGWYILGKEVESFELEFAKYLGTKHAVGVSNGLEAIQISLMALGIGPGDEVITTPLSAVATTLAILSLGATPVFVDVREDGQINESLIVPLITPKTKAILPVHLYGNPSSIYKIQDIAQSHNLFLIEDSAQAHGSIYQGKKLGTIGDLGCYSFYPTKNLGAIGDAGAIVTNNDEYAAKCRQIRDYGQSEKYVHIRYGLNSRLDEVHASILREKLKHLDIMNQRRIKNANLYSTLLSSDHLTIISPEIDSLVNYHQFVILVKNRDLLQAALKKENIPTLVHYPSIIPDQPMFKGKYSQLSLPVARKFVTEVLSLPCGPYMTVSQIKKVSQVINEFSSSFK